jgi:hypothetical protein
MSAQDLEPRDEVSAVLLLCDAAQVANGKLYMLGGGWTHLWTADTPANIALAIKLDVPWNMANRKIKLEAALLDEDGNQVSPGGRPIRLEGDLEVGRPAGLKAGTDLVIPIAFTLNGVVLPAGGYTWELSINGSLIASSPFRVLQRPNP